MRLSEILRLVWLNLSQNKFKVILTSIGIVVGSATIMLVLAIGTGGKEEVAEQFKNLNAGAIDISCDSSDSGGFSFEMPGGGGSVTVTNMGGGPGGGSGGGTSGGPGGGRDFGGFFGFGQEEESEAVTLTSEDCDDLATFVSGISATTISYSTTASVEGGDMTSASYYTIAGVEDNYAAISNLEMAIGDFLTEENNESKEKVCVLGAITFCLQGCVQWDGTHIALSMIMLSLLCTIFFIPAMPGAGYEVRGNGEMFPLNGPCWSLFFEYLGNILYALFIHRLSNKALAVLTILLGVALASFAIFDISGYGNMGVGWTLDGINFGGGLLRMLFPFSMGMLLSRNFKPIKVKGAFWICAIALVTLFSVPYLEGATPVCTNGIYEAFCVIIAFPVLVWLGASGTTTDKKSTQICKFLGDISYPVYVIHYPFMYLFYAWLIKNQLFTLEQTWQVALCVYAWNILLAYLCLKFYDEPVRKYLARRFLSKKQ